MSERLPGRDFSTPDDPAHCALCGKETSVAMIAIHLIEEHGYSAEEIANAPIFTEGAPTDEGAP